ncbi:MAG: guanitoxin biosynthesis MBL fold metallo-hydrolase GntH [Pirellulales bacterium]
MSIKKATTPIVLIVFLAGIVGYLIGNSNSEQENEGKAQAAQDSTETEKANKAEISKPSPVKPVANRGVYYPGTEELKPDEMRVICLGSGMPMPRLKQAAASFLIELGNGDKFIFDLGTGAMHRLYAFGIQLDYIDKVFLTHLHMDHAGDLPAFYIYGPQNNRSVPLRVWGPGGGGTRPEWGTKASMDHMQESWAWMTGTLKGLIDDRSFSMEVTEYDWSKVNNVIYDHNDVVIKSIPAIHLEQSASFILEWNGLTLAYSGDTLPNRWWIEHTRDADLAIHECIFTPELGVSKWGFSPPEALNAVTTVHANPMFFGKVMAMSQPKHAVAYHFQNDADTVPIVMNAVEKYYDGPVDYAQDFMVWNVTKEGVQTRMTVPNPEAYPTPPLQEKQVAVGDDRYQTPDFIIEGFPEEVKEVADEIYEDFNKKNGTDFKFKLKK